MSTADFWVGPPSAPDKYRLVSLLGGGGEGEVWQAVLPLSTEGRSTVAVKLLQAWPGDEQEWEQTGRLLPMLHHPGLVRVTDVFTGPAMHRAGLADLTTRAGYVVMDHIDGMTLREWCDENPDAPASFRIRMLRTVASALDEMHSGTTTNVPVAHGDVKPANIIVRDGGGTVLVDLGLTRLTDAVGVSGRSAPYAAPELRGSRVMATIEADRYAFAVTTAQVFTGQPLPTGPDGWLDEKVLQNLLQRSPITARRPMLIQHVLAAIAAPAEARPHRLRPWLDSAAETLSQVTNRGEQPPAGPYIPDLSEYQTAGTWQPVPPEPENQAPPIPPPTPPHHRVPAEPRRRPQGWWPLAAAASVLALVGAVYLLWPQAGTDNANHPTVLATNTTTPPTTTPTTAATRTTDSTKTTPASLSPGAIGQPSAGRPTNLSAINPVTTSYVDNLSTGAEEIGTTTYQNSVRFTCYQTGFGGHVTYNVAGYKFLDATIGVPNDANNAVDNAMAITFFKDGSTQMDSPLNVALGQPQSVHLDLQGAAQLKIKCDPDSEMDIVFGDATIDPGTPAVSGKN